MLFNTILRTVLLEGLVCPSSKTVRTKVNTVLIDSNSDELSTPLTKRLCRLVTPGVVPYATAWDWQRSLVASRRSDPSLDDVLILLEHPPVYTLGQGSNLDFLKFDPTASSDPIFQIERGGEVTYHCPGQLVGYTILNLKYYQQDLHWYLRQLEEVLIQVLALNRLAGERIPGLTGVWLADHKVGAIGIKVSRWITMHGFALNVCPDLQGFGKIVPCGIADKPIGSLAQFIPEISVATVIPQIIESFTTVFEVHLQAIALRELGLSI